MKSWRRYVCEASCKFKKRGGYVNNTDSPYQAAQGVVPNAVADHFELDTIDSKGYKLTLAYEGDDMSYSLTIDETDQDNIPPFAQLTNTIPNWSTAFGVGASALTGGLKLWPIEIYKNDKRHKLLILILLHTNFQLLEEQVLIFLAR